MIELTYKYEFFERKPKLTHTTLGRKMGWIVINKYDILRVESWLTNYFKDGRSFKYGDNWWLYHATDGLNLIKYLTKQETEFKLKFEYLLKNSGIFGLYNDTYPLPSEVIKNCKTHVDEPNDTIEVIAYLAGMSDEIANKNVMEFCGVIRRSFYSMGNEDIYLKHSTYKSIEDRLNNLKNSLTNIDKSSRYNIGNEERFVKAGPLLQILMLVYFKSVLYDIRDILTDKITTRVINLTVSEDIYTYDSVLSVLSEENKTKSAEILTLRSRKYKSETDIRLLNDSIKELDVKLKQLKAKHKKQIEIEKEYTELLSADDGKIIQGRKLRME